MPTTIARRLGALLLSLMTVVLVACGGGAAASQPAGTDEGADPADTGTSSLAPAGARSFFAYDQTADALVRIDPDTGTVDTILDLDRAAHAMDQGDGALWLGMEDGAVLRVDPASGATIAEIAPTASDGLFDVAVGAGAAWTLHGVPGAGTSLVRIDTTANTAGEPIASAEGLTFFDVEADDAAVWLVGSSAEMATTLYAVDAATGELEDQHVQMVIDGIATGDSAVWLAGTIFPDGAIGVPGVGRFDPASGELETIELPAEPDAIAVGSGGVWAASGVGADGTTLYRIDEDGLALAAEIPLGEAEGGRVRISTGAGAVWVTTDGGASYVVDPADDSVAGEGDSVGGLGVYFAQ